jgi:hypothetical protein
MTLANITAIHIAGRRWFQRTYGNTYCSAVVTITFQDGSSEQINIPKQYGYGDFYLQAATDALERAGYMPDRKHAANGSAEPAWRYFRDDRKIPFHYSAIDVSRERDL